VDEDLKWMMNGVSPHHRILAAPASHPNDDGIVAVVVLDVGERDPLGLLLVTELIAQHFDGDIVGIVLLRHRL